MNYDNITTLNKPLKNYPVKSKSDVSAGKNISSKYPAYTGKKEDIVQVSENTGKKSFAEELKACRSNIVSDIQKQASIDAKEQVKEDVLSGRYTINPAGIADKIITKGFDYKI